MSSHCESQVVIQQVPCFSLGDECLDDIKADLISLTVDDSNFSSLNTDVKNSSLQSAPKSSSDDNTVPTRKDTHSASLLVISNSFSKENSVFSSTETLTQCSDAELSKMCNISSQEVIDSESYNRTEKLNLTALEQTTLQHSTNAQNIHGYTQSHNQDNRSFAKCKLSLSLHDVSTLPDFPLKCKSRNFSSDTIQNQSIVTISSGLKSKDSGLSRSLSCFSLSSDKKNYDHIQSKVKEYIRQIKETDERRKAPKLGGISNKSIHVDDLKNVNAETKFVASEETLKTAIKDLQYELQEKDVLLSKLQENYDKLLIKYAEAENRIDQLRFKVIDPSLELVDRRSSVLNSAEKYISPYNRTSDVGPDAKSLPSVIRDSCFSKISTYSDKTVSSENPSLSALFSEHVTLQNVALNPLVKPYCSSVRLGNGVKPLLQNPKAKPFEESFKSKLSGFNRISKGSSNTERKHGSLVKQSSNTQSHEQLGSAACLSLNLCCQCMENDGTAQGDKHVTEVLGECGFSHSRQHKEIPMTSEIKIPNYCDKTFLCRRSLEESDADCTQNTSFEKVRVLFWGHNSKVG
jgi:hypothetical protein